jgi:peptidoglycan/LPS O-acetylase OafA/YrhL
VEARERIPVLDGLRALAILLVFQFHVVQVTRHLMPPDDRAGVDELMFRLFLNGYAGVDLFFVLSGFLITGILVDAKSGSSYFRAFYGRRVLRIFPLYYAFILYLLLLPSWRSLDGFLGGFAGMREHQWWFWLYLQNIPVSLPEPTGLEGFPGVHLWSLAIEEQFYLVWPAVVLVCSRAWLMRVCVAAIVGALVFRIMASLDTSSSWAYELTPYYFTPARLDALAIGALVACLVRNAPLQQRLKPAAWPILLGSLGVLVGLGAWYGQLSPFELGVHTAGFSALALFFGAGLWLLVTSSDKTWVHGFLSGETLRAIGKYSYAMYLFHPIVLAELGNRVSEQGVFPRVGGAFAGPLLLYDLVALAMTFGLAWLSWQLVESPALQLKRFFPYHGGSARRTDQPPGPDAVNTEP